MSKIEDIDFSPEAMASFWKEHPEELKELQEAAAELVSMSVKYYRRQFKLANKAFNKLGYRRNPRMERLNPNTIFYTKKDFGTTLIIYIHKTAKHFGKHTIDDWGSCILFEEYKAINKMAEALDWFREEKDEGRY